MLRGHYTTETTLQFEDTQLTESVCLKVHVEGLCPHYHHRKPSVIATGQQFTCGHFIPCVSNSECKCLTMKRTLCKLSPCYI